MHRSNLTGNMADFIYLAETRIRTLMRERVQDKISQIDTIAGVEYVLLDEDFLALKSLTIPGLHQTLSYMDQTTFYQNYESSVTGLPRSYTIIDSQIHLGPTPDAVYTLQAVYRFDMVPLSDLAPLNPMLAKWPNVYLFASLVEAADFSRNIPLRDSFNARLLEAVENANVLEFNKNGPMTVRSDVRSF
jgi:hypothetical protein